MVRRVSPAQFRSMIRQAEQKQRRAVDQANRAIRDYNRTVDDFNRKQRQAVAEYNREVRSTNARVRADRTRLQNELRRLSASRTTSTVTVRYRTSTSLITAVGQSFGGVESAVESGRWADPDNLLDLAEGETADSVAALNRLIAPEDPGEGDLRSTALTTELTDIDPELHARWTGALFALNPKNPDAARHFCTSARELITMMLDREAPDSVVKAANPDYLDTPSGGVSRRAKIHYCLGRKGNDIEEMVEFVHADIDGVIGLFDDFNRGTHGAAGRFPLAELVVLKDRVERAVKFLYRIIR